MEEKFEDLLAKFPTLEVVPKTNRVRCKLSGHEMPYKIDLVESYVKGKKFQKLQKDAHFNFDALKPFLIPSECRKNQLFCGLTGRYINRLPHHVEKHMTGKRYTRTKMKYDTGEREIMLEPHKKGIKKVEDEEEILSDRKEKEDSLVGTEMEEESRKDVQPNELVVVEKKRKKPSQEEIPRSKKIKLLMKKKVELKRNRRVYKSSFTNKA